MFRVEIDRSLCSGFGSCADLAPRNLILGEDGLARVTDPRTDDPSILEAAASCPMAAIAVFDELREVA